MAVDFEHYEALLKRADYTKAHLLTMRDNAMRINEVRYVRAGSGRLNTNQESISGSAAG